LEGRRFRWGLLNAKRAAGGIWALSPADF
jgi:hypothetical protein